MAANVRFTIQVNIKNGAGLPELAGRLKDLSPAFAAVIPEWAALNEQKFNLSRGQEMSGADVDELVFWEGLRPATMKSKRRRVRPDWIMVDTGSLMQSMSDPDLIHQAITAQDAVFGTPTKLKDARKVQYNWPRRQAVFLSTIDQNMVRRILKDYLEMGGDFQEKRFAKGLERVYAAREEADMDAGFDVGDTGAEGDGE